MSSATDQITGLNLSGLGDGTLTLSVTLTDTAGNAATAVTNTATLDTSLPTLSSSTPANNATDVAYNTSLVLNFSEAMSAGAGNIIVYAAVDNSQVDSIAANSSAVVIVGAQASITLGATLSSTTAYYVQIDSTAFTDVSGNPYAGISDTSSLNFTTGNQQAVAANDSTSTNEDNAVQVIVLDNDSDTDGTLNAASVMVVGQPNNGSTSVNTANGVVTYTPNADFNGSDSFTYSVEDNDSLASNIATVSVTVNAVNDVPVAVADQATTAEDNPVTVNVAANDTDVDAGDSADPATLVVVSQPLNGSAVVNSGQIDYTPSANFNGTDTFTYTIEDTQGGVSSAATVTINVTSVNDLPTTAVDSASVDEDDSVKINVLANDSDIDGTLDATTVTVQVAPTNGSTQVDPVTGEITYTPAANFNGSDSFTYTVKDDADGTSNAATVSVNINSVNDAPVATDDSATLMEDNPMTINVLGNDSDVDGTLVPNSVQVVTAPLGGSTSVNTTTGAIVYTPAENFFGSDSLTYRVQDDQGEYSQPATITLTVTAVNDAPLANADSFVLDEDTPATLTILANDSDVDGTLDVSAITIVSTVENGSLSDNGDGTLEYTPSANFNGSDSFTYRVSDDGDAQSNDVTVTLSVTAVNDAPTISGTPDTYIVQRNSYVFTPSLGDVENDTLSVSATGLPDWLTLNVSTGEISGTAATAGTFSGIVLTVSDGDKTTSLASFAIEVDLDTDSDNSPDSADTDDDNDGLSDTYEISIGLDPLDATDAAQDKDGDTLTNLQEFLDGTDPEDAGDYYDVTAPVITVPATRVLDATALFTPVSLNQLLGLSSSASESDLSNALAALTTDNVDGLACCATSIPALVTNRLLLPTGRNVVQYRAVDRKGNVGTATQIVNIRPLVSVNKDQTSVEGAAVRFKVLLNGQSPYYPLTVPYVIDNASTADSDDHDLVTGSVTFSKSGEVGEVEQEVLINLIDDAIAETTETLIVRLDDQTTNAQDLIEGYDEANPDIYDINAGAKIAHRISIVETNVAPNAALSINQGGINTIQITPDGGAVTVSASVVDPNPGDSVSYDWSASDGSLVDTDGNTVNNTLVFDPAGLSSGRYLVQLTIADNANATDSTRLYFSIVPALPTLVNTTDTDGDGVNDADEGTADSDDDGIPDYLDNITATNVLPQVARETDSFLVECDPGVRCRLGQFALLGTNAGVRLEEEDFVAQGDLIEDPLFDNVGGLFDFEVEDLLSVGQSVSVVMPQVAAIPENGIYRKLQNGEWRNFVVDANNQLHSAPGSLGFCPPPGDDSYEIGLVAGYFCIQLTIEDGGPNDADGVANGSVADPGGVGIDNRTEITVVSSSKGEGGSLGLWWLMAIAGLSALRDRRFRVLALLALVMVLPMTASAEEGHSDKLAVNLGLYEVDSSVGKDEFIQGLDDASINTAIREYDTRRFAWQIGVSYRYAESFAIEAGYLNLGEADVNFTASALDDATLKSALKRHYPVSGEGLTLAHRFSGAINDQLGVSFIMGVYWWRGEVDANGTNLDIKLDGGVDPMVGVAMHYQVAPKLECQLEWNQIVFDHQKANLLGLRFGYRL